MPAIAVIVFLAILISGIILLIGLVRANKINDNYRLLLQSRDEIIADLKTLESQWRERVEDLEDSIKKDYGIQTRIVRNEVNCVFDKIEMAIIQAGVTQLLKRPDLSVDDAQYYINLIHKISEVLPDMEEPVATSEPSSRRPKP